MELPRLSGAERPWLAQVLSAPDGIQHAPAPADLGQRRLASVLRWHAEGRAPAVTPWPGASDLPFGAALRASAARRSHAFTPYDGNLAELSRRPARLTPGFGGAAASASSATGEERWATCHFRYFLQNVLRVDATRRPEDEWTITPIDRGKLVHTVFERFFSELRGAMYLFDSARLAVRAFFVAVLLLVVQLIPVAGNAIAIVAGAFFMGWVLALELTSVPFERRGMHYGRRKRELRRHRRLTLGFGAATFFCFLIPLGAVIFMPAAVAGATLLSRHILQPE